MVKKTIFSLIAISAVSLFTACSAQNFRANGSFAGATAETMKTISRPFEMGVEVQDKVISASSSKFTVLGIISWGDDIYVSSTVAGPVGLDSNPVRNAAAKAVWENEVDAIYVTNVDSERFRLIDIYDPPPITPKKPITVALAPVLLPVKVMLGFIQGLYSRTTVTVTGRAVKLKPLGVVSPARLAKKEDPCCK